MPETRFRLREPTAPALDLPPPYRLVTLRELGDAHAHAVRIAATAGAGTLVWVRRYDLVELAVVLEPDEPLAAARRAFQAGMVALADALAAHAPPEMPIAIRWPDALLVDGALVGGARLAWPEGADEDAPPDWLVFSAMLRASAMEAVEPGAMPDLTSLEGEGFEAAGPGRMVESFARHLMVAIDAWQERGFAGIAAEYLRHLPADGTARRAIDGNGDLLVFRGDGKPARMALADALASPSWRDPATGLPRA
ncbi:MAG: biotin/lipoate--protein ligase family protein [Alphaproteobacteria bacterium]